MVKDRPLNINDTANRVTPHHCYCYCDVMHAESLMCTDTQTEKNENITSASIHYFHLGRDKVMTKTSKLVT